MREVLFRGKTTDGGWVYGSYIPSIGNEKFCAIKDNTPLRMVHLCKSETVGQYTGLTDKNGKKIFEGDILAFSDRLVYVHWHDYCGCWDCSYIKAIDGKETLREYRNPNKWRFIAQIISNIHDNPELLEADNG